MKKKKHNELLINAGAVIMCASAFITMISSAQGVVAISLFMIGVLILLDENGEEEEEEEW